MIVLIVIAVGFYFISTISRGWLEGSLVAILGVNTILFLAYLGVAYLLEGKAVRAAIQ